jgi:hypothetical protein
MALSRRGRRHKVVERNNDRKAVAATSRHDECRAVERNLALQAPAGFNALLGMPTIARADVGGDNGVAGSEE